MKKLKLILAIVMAVVCVFALGTAAQAATYGNLIYSVENDEVTITGYNGTGTELTIPAEISGCPVTAIGEYAFEDVYFTKLEIPGSITRIGDYAFDGATLDLVKYNGLADDYYNIEIGINNRMFIRAETIYNVYVTLLDKSGNEISKKIQKTDELVDVSGITVPQGYELKLYTDSALVYEYYNDVPMIHHTTLYVDIVPIKQQTITTISEDGKTFTVSGKNLENGCMVILALYEDERLVEMQSKVYNSVDLPFTTTKDYDMVKVMVWGSLGNLVPKTETEIISLKFRWASDIMVITSAYNRTNDDGISGRYITGLVNGKSVRIFAPTAEMGATEVYSVSTDGTSVGIGDYLGKANVLYPGDIIQYGGNSKGETDKIVRLQSATAMDRYIDNGNFSAPYTRLGGAVEEGIEYEYYLGYVVEASYFLAIQKDMTPGSYDERICFAYDSEADVVKVDTNYAGATKVSAGAWEDAWADTGLAWGYEGKNGDFVFIKTQADKVVDMVVYKGDN